jgi:hypothetical protein
MARKDKTEYAPPTGEILLPDEKDFRPPDLRVLPDAKPGRVEGLDYDKWAAALIDLNGDPARIAAERIRLTSKGFQRVEGEPVVSGYQRAEVWVMPRAMYDQRREMRAVRLRQLVESKQMTEFALPRGDVIRG